MAGVCAPDVTVRPGGLTVKRAKKIFKVVDVKKKKGKKTGFSYLRTSIFYRRHLRVKERTKAETHGN